MKEEKRSSTGFLVKQRAFLKLYMITMTEQERLYGLKLLEVLRSEFKEIGFKPNHTEVYRSLHELLDDGILKQIKVKKEGAKLQEVVLYQFKDYETAKLYKKQLKVELDRCKKLIEKALSDNF
ncbi:replication termination protein [Bacillus rugosus]|uniref:Replication termination protein n=1 Tax=Bacillus rugosus TaxID=2715209 RepID=A0ACD4A419_9BACI|nr:replication termination protein [Bacillus rugosus]UPV80986.1 replication termination protein [Bacillus rugosus]